MIAVDRLSKCFVFAICRRRVQSCLGFQGIAALISEFNGRKQALYFYNPRSDVVAVLKGACGEEFQYVSTREELTYVLHNTRGNTALIIQRRNHMHYPLPRCFLSGKYSQQPLMEIRRDRSGEPSIGNPELTHRSVHTSSSHELNEIKTTLLQASGS